jgi:DNA-binding response OmpR family regulator
LVQEIYGGFNRRSLHEYRNAMDTFQRAGIAVVIEFRKDLADTVCDLLTSYGYLSIAAPTHAEAAQRAVDHHKVTLLAASVPAPDENRAGIYLAEASRKNPGMAVVLMLSDPLEAAEDAPQQSIRIVKPFSREELIVAITASEALALEFR